ncbi:MAG TPA: NrfD/PsrC family molybdoenzyme membrane anchor subunit [Terriglobales bacterium]|nr:NrfD/PsrC family molybdoenzyme membrane anchor subunit [Terriglobales bacterium]
MTDPLQRPAPEYTDWSRENRLFEIRREAQEKGHVPAQGVRPPGAPFPTASPETGYYGVPLLKQAPWTWEIPAYFFVGGATGCVAMVGAAARWTGRGPELARDCRYVSVLGAMLSSALLIGDLGRPSRFLGMLRVFKRQSPMSVGAWTLCGFGAFSSIAALAEWINPRLDSAPLRIAGNTAEALSALLGLPLASYTGVLIGATVIPVWNHSAETLPIHFAMTGLNSAVSILELMGHENRALNTLGMGASAIEILEGMNVEGRKKPELEPLKRGTSGVLTRLGGLLSGPVPLALRLAAAFAGKRRARKLRKIAAGCSIAGSMLTRVGWLRAGHASAKDWRLPLQI